MLQQLIYRTIYNRNINYLLRWFNKGLSPILPASLQLPPSGVIHVKSGENGFLLDTNQTSYLTQRLFWDGPDAFEYTTLFRQLIRKVDTFLDVGANIGYYTFLACSENREIRVWSFEPAEGAYRYLVRNLQLNRAGDQVTVEKLALSNQTGRITFHEVTNPKYPWLREVLSGESNATTKSLDRDYATTQVEADTLDAWYRRERIPRLDLIKIDTEGAEVAVLEGGRETLAEQRPIIICEILFNLNESDIERFMKELGYTFYLFRDGQLHPADTLIREVDDGIRDCFFVHPDRYPLIAEFVA